MMRNLITLLCTLFVLSSTGTASAVMYESYEGFQEVKEGQEFYFDFDLIEKTPGYTTNSSMKMVNDEAMGCKVGPLKSAFVDIDLYSVERSWEEATIKLFLYDYRTTYTLYDSDVNGALLEDDSLLDMSFDISDTYFVNDPWGVICIKALVSWDDGNWKDFAITKVAIGGEPGGAPVPEPATMLLLGTGLIGLAGIGRKKFK